MSAPISSAPSETSRGKIPLLLGTLVLGAGLAVGALYLLGWVHLAPVTKAAKEDEKKEDDKDPTLIVFPESRWESAGLKLEPATVRPFQERIRRTGRVALDEEHLAHLCAPLEGVIQDVPVRLGQDVKAGDILAVLDCRELAQAKMELYKIRTTLEHAKMHHQWAETTQKNTEELLKLLAENTPVNEIETRMKDRPIGESRQLLISANVNRIRLRTQYDSIRANGRDAMSESGLLKIKAEYDAAEATYRSTVEETRHKTRREFQTAEQKLQEVRTNEAIARNQLQLLGLSEAEIAKLDPIAEGGKASLFPIKAPFDGTIVERHAVRSERVNSTHQLFQLANLSQVWIYVDVYENDLPLVRGLKGQSVNCRSSVVSESVFPAEVFYTGDVLDKSTRAITLTASAPNPERKLKPGMFIDVELAKPPEEKLQVPQSAIFRIGTQSCVFVHEKDDQFRKVDIVVGREQEEWAEVLSGLKPGQIIAATGGFLLKTELLRDQLAGE